MIPSYCSLLPAALRTHTHRHTDVCQCLTCNFSCCCLKVSITRNKVNTSKFHHRTVLFLFIFLFFSKLREHKDTVWESSWDIPGPLTCRFFLLHQHYSKLQIYFKCQIYLIWQIKTCPMFVRVLKGNVWTEMSKRPNKKIPQHRGLNNFN